MQKIKHLPRNYFFLIFKCQITKIYDTTQYKNYLSLGYIFDLQPIYKLNEVFDVFLDLILTYCISDGDILLDLKLIFICDLEWYLAVLLVFRHCLFGHLSLYRDCGKVVLFTC